MRMAIDLYVSEAENRGWDQTRWLGFRWLQTGESSLIPFILLHISKAEEEFNISLKTNAEIVGM